MILSTLEYKDKDLFVEITRYGVRVGKNIELSIDFKVTNIKDGDSFKFTCENMEAVAIIAIMFGGDGIIYDNYKTRFGFKDYGKKLEEIAYKTLHRLNVPEKFYVIPFYE